MNKSYIINLGLIAGALSIVVFLLNAIITAGWVVLTSVFIVSLAITIWLASYFVKRQRLDNNGFILFKHAFLLVFLGLALAGAISTVFSVIYTEFIDTEYAQRTTYNSMKMTKGLVEGRIGDEQMEQILRETEAQMMQQFSTVGFIKSFFYMLIFNAVVALIIAAIMKRNPQLSTPSAEDILDR